jgi:hypothetical protein
MKSYQIILVVSFFLIFGCSSLPDIDYYKENHKELYNKNNKNDTIYIYFKHTKYEKFKSYKFSKPKFKYQNNYSFRFPKIKIHPKIDLYFTFMHVSHIYKNGVKVENKIIEKDKKFLKQIRNKMYSYKDFKNLNSIEISYFYNYNNFKTVYLIDKKENKNGKVYLRETSLGSNYPKIL